MQFWKFVGGFAPIIFFSIAGYHSVHLLKKYEFKGIFLYALLLFLFGFTFNGILGRGLHVTFYFDVFQCIGIGVLSVVVASMFVKNKYQWFLLFLAAIGLYYLLPPLQDGVLTPISHTATSFSIFPWLSLFFLGAFLSFSTPKHAWQLALFFFLAIPFIAYCNLPSDAVISGAKLIIPGVITFSFLKWVPSLEYLSLTFGLICLMFVVIGSNKGESSAFWRYFGFVGRESLEFHYWHILVIAALIGVPLEIKAHLSQFAIWFFVFAAALFTTWISYWSSVIKSRKQQKAPLSSSKGWLIYGLILVSGTIFFSYKPMLANLFWLFAASFFADQYRYLRPSLLKVKPVAEAAP